jgi:hypothetical protein
VRRTLAAAAGLLVLVALAATASAQVQTPPPTPPASRPIVISGYGGLNTHEFTHRNYETHALIGFGGGLDVAFSRFVALSTEVTVRRSWQRQECCVPNFTSSFQGCAMHMQTA